MLETTLLSFLLHCKIVPFYIGIGKPMSDSRVIKALETEKNKDLQFTGDYFPNELLLLIAFQMSIFDVPTLVVVSRFLASNSNILWEYHAERLYRKHPHFQLVKQRLKQILGEEEKKPRGPDIRPYQDQYHLFFGMYRTANSPSRRRALQIIEGKIDDLIYENKNGIPSHKDEKRLRPLTTIEFFNCKTDFVPCDFYISDLELLDHQLRALEVSLFDLAHGLPADQKKELLDHLYVSVQHADKSETFPAEFDILKHPPSELAHPILRRAFDVPYLTLQLYLDLKKHLSVNDSEPLFAAIKQNNIPIILLLVDCKVELNEMEKQKISDELIEIERWGCEFRHSGEDDFLMGYNTYADCTKPLVLSEQEYSSPIPKDLPKR